MFFLSSDSWKMKAPSGPGDQGKQGVGRGNILHSAGRTAAWQLGEHQGTAPLSWFLAFSRWVPAELGRGSLWGPWTEVVHTLRAVEAGRWEGKAVDSDHMSMVHAGSSCKVDRCLAQLIPPDLAK
uniref:Uncharacterized protein n=1 Tax=Myotis myotis TaxID=51298 RepID=A0A7J8AMK0_MYOMY|nr:hypothetical protein mMyoMyo1_007839 [Myotis myotis]